MYMYDYVCIYIYVYIQPDMKTDLTINVNFTVVGQYGNMFIDGDYSIQKVVIKLCKVWLTNLKIFTMNMNIRKQTIEFIVNRNEYKDT